MTRGVHTYVNNKEALKKYDMVRIMRLNKSDILCVFLSLVDVTKSVERS